MMIPILTGYVMAVVGAVALAVIVTTPLGGAITLTVYGLMLFIVSLPWGE